MQKYFSAFSRRSVALSSSNGSDRAYLEGVGEEIMQWSDSIDTSFTSRQKPKTNRKTLLKPFAKKI